MAEFTDFVDEVHHDCWQAQQEINRRFKLAQAKASTWAPRDCPEDYK